MDVDERKAAAEILLNRDRFIGVVNRSVEKELENFITRKVYFKFKVGGMEIKGKFSPNEMLNRIRDAYADKLKGNEEISKLIDEKKSIMNEFNKAVERYNKVKKELLAIEDTIEAKEDKMESIENSIEKWGKIREKREEEIVNAYKIKEKKMENLKEVLPEYEKSIEEIGVEKSDIIFQLSQDLEKNEDRVNKNIEYYNVLENNVWREYGEWVKRYSRTYKRMKEIEKEIEELRKKYGEVEEKINEIIDNHISHPLTVLISEMNMSPKERYLFTICVLRKFNDKLSKEDKESLIKVAEKSAELLMAVNDGKYIIHFSSLNENAVPNVISDVYANGGTVKRIASTLLRSSDITYDIVDDVESSITNWATKYGSITFNEKPMLPSAIIQHYRDIERYNPEIKDRVKQIEKEIEELNKEKISIEDRLNVLNGKIKDLEYKLEKEMGEEAKISQLISKAETIKEINPDKKEKLNAVIELHRERLKTIRRRSEELIGGIIEIEERIKEERLKERIKEIKDKIKEKENEIKEMVDNVIAHPIAVLVSEANITPTGRYLFSNYVLREFEGKLSKEDKESLIKVAEKSAELLMAVNDGAYMLHWNNTKDRFIEKVENETEVVEIGEEVPPETTTEIVEEEAKEMGKEEVNEKVKREELEVVEVEKSRGKEKDEEDGETDIFDEKEYLEIIAESDTKTKEEVVEETKAIKDIIENLRKNIEDKKWLIVFGHKNILKEDDGETFEKMANGEVDDIKGKIEFISEKYGKRFSQLVKNTKNGSWESTMETLKSTTIEHVNHLAESAAENDKERVEKNIKLLMEDVIDGFMIIGAVEGIRKPLDYKKSGRGAAKLDQLIGIIKNGIRRIEEDGAITREEGNELISLIMGGAVKSIDAAISNYKTLTGKFKFSKDEKKVYRGIYRLAQIDDSLSKYKDVFENMFAMATYKEKEKKEKAKDKAELKDGPKEEVKKEKVEEAKEAPEEKSEEEVEEEVKETGREEVKEKVKREEPEVEEVEAEEVREGPIKEEDYSDKESFVVVVNPVKSVEKFAKVDVSELNEKFLELITDNEIIDNIYHATVASKSKIKSAINELWENVIERILTNDEDERDTAIKELGLTVVYAAASKNIDIIIDKINETVEEYGMNDEEREERMRNGLMEIYRKAIDGLTYAFIEAEITAFKDIVHGFASNVYYGLMNMKRMILNEYENVRDALFPQNVLEKIYLGKKHGEMDRLGALLANAEVEEKKPPSFEYVKRILDKADESYAKEMGYDNDEDIKENLWAYLNRTKKKQRKVGGIKKLMLKMKKPSTSVQRNN